MTLPLQVTDLGRCPFLPAFQRQEELVEARKAGTVPDTLLLVEHDPVYTLGRNATTENIIVSEEELTQRGIDVVRTTRGGQVTYHGPGQLVGYPIMDLGVRDRKALWFVGNLERVLIEALAEFGVEGATDPANRGVWVGSEKIAALGVRITRHITMHGFSLNVKVKLEDYGGIIPCGIKGRGVTSLDRFVADITMDRVKVVLVEKFKAVFGYGPVELVKETG